ASPSAAPAGGGSGNLRNPLCPVHSPFTNGSRKRSRIKSVSKKCLQTQLLTSLKPLSIHTHNRNGPPFGGPFLFLFFCPRGDADMPLLPPSPDPIEGPGGEEGAPEQGGGPPPG